METESVVTVALQKSPRVLLLGQTYLGTNVGENPLFTAFAAVHSAESPYRYWLESGGELGARAEQFMMVDRTVQVSEEIGQLLRSAWNCVFTSCVDSTTRQQLVIPDRRLVSQITSSNFDRIDHNSLTLFRLFGTVERVEDLPPSHLASLRQRRTEAVAMLSKLPELITPTGCLFIEGWDPRPSGDWLRPRDLDKALLSFLAEQVLIFGLSDAQIELIREEEDFGELVRQGTVLLFKERLVDVFASLLRKGVIQQELTQGFAERTIPYQVLRVVRRKSFPRSGLLAEDDRLVTVEIPKLQWNRFSQELSIIEPLDPTQPLPESRDLQYHEFRTFLSSGFSSPPWKWLRHFAFRRPTLQGLLDTVLPLCAEDTPQDHVVILHGPSGSGKTIILQLLALDLRKHGLPVVYIGDNVNFSDHSGRGLIDELGLLLELNGSAAPIVVIFDGLEKDETYNITKYLAGRGRKCLVIGSAFSWQAPRVSPKRGSRPVIHPVALPPTMQYEEKENLLLHLERFIPQADADLAALLELTGVTDSYFFAVLYRSLPYARRRIERGFIQEIEEASKQIQEQIESTRGQSYPGITLMEMKLREALEHHQDLLVERLKAQDAEGETYESVDALLLINAVMLASCVGQSVPISLALRLIRNNFRAYAKSIPEDIIVEHESTSGLVTLSARHQLEAEIWIRHRLPRGIDQSRLLSRLVLQIRANEVDEDQSPELEFVVKLLQAFGPQSSVERYQLRHDYDKIAQIVEDLRTRYSRIHPRLLLLGSNAIREWIQRLQPHLAANPEEAAATPWSARLKAAEDGLAEAIEIVRSGADRPLRGAARRMLATLETEQACILGVQIGSIRRLVDTEKILLTAWQQKLDEHFNKARATWLRALSYSEDNFHAVDTICWISLERLQAGGLDEEARIGLLAHWSEAIDRYLELDIPPSQLSKRDDREAEFSRTLGDRQRFEIVLQRLARRSPAAAYALEARFIAREEGPERACAYLESNCEDQLLSNRILLVPYFRIWWQAHTGLPTFFPEERLALNFDRDKWSRLRALCEARLRCEGEQENGTALFLEGCALMHLGLTVQALQIFDHLESLDLGGFRRARALMLLSDSEGRVLTANGEYRGRRRGSNFLAWCDDLGINIPFNPTDHHFTEPREGRVVGPFYVALNYRGPYALPLYRVQHRA